MSRAARSLALLAELAEARRVCDMVRTETGGLLPDDECALGLAAAEAALDAHDLAGGYDRLDPRRTHGGAASDQDEAPPC